MNYNLLKFDQLFKIEPLLIKSTNSRSYAECTLINYKITYNHDCYFHNLPVCASDCKLYNWKCHRYERTF